MQINLSLVNVQPGSVADAFEDRVAHLLIDHLYTECVLDQEGIKRVIPLLKKAYMSSSKGLSVDAVIPCTEMDAEAAKAYQEQAQRFIRDLALNTERIMDENRLTFMISLATALAEQDEKLIKRTQH